MKTPTVGILIQVSAEIDKDRRSVMLSKKSECVVGMLPIKPKTIFHNATYLPRQVIAYINNSVINDFKEMVRP